ncbi:uncharacterized protein [Aegilops tauschii subsp. strangulata]|uniref:uncharacterized protein n=1 Tax=Aegilops tauschii subsp. strangulata TaxID=200361 RepID=UPI000989AE68|nr:uncharacterized protein LOC109731950 [Aegilops tauschii subsp. strangulata]XP_044420461.1 uncharacterized protein LOC123145182 [Triticum aestivum]
MRAALPNHRFSDSTSSLVTMEGGVLLRSGRTIFYRRDDEAVVSGELVLQEKEHAQEKKEHAQDNKKEQDKALRTWDRCCWTWDLGLLLLDLGPRIAAAGTGNWDRCYCVPPWHPWI